MIIAILSKQAIDDGWVAFYKGSKPVHQPASSGYIGKIYMHSTGSS